ncbi:MAG: hypothetical protein HMLIMOIP_002678, partial [Candidatus Nitrosomirales archaeon]
MSDTRVRETLGTLMSGRNRNLRQIAQEMSLAMPPSKNIRSFALLSLLSFVVIVGISTISDNSIPILGFYLQEAYADTNSAGAAYKSASTGCTGTAVNIPRYRDWNQATEAWESEVCLTDTGSEIINVRLEFSRILRETVIVTQSVDGTLNLFFCNTGSCSSAADWSIPTGCTDFADVYGAEPARPHRAWDMEYENVSGDVIIFFAARENDANTAQDIGYVTFDGASCSAITYVNLGSIVSTSDPIIGHVACEPFSDATSDKIGCILIDRTAANQDSIAFIWSGTAIGNDVTVSTAIGAASDDDESVWGEAEKSSSDFLVVSGNDKNSIAWREWDHQTNAWGSVCGGAICPDPNPPGVNNDVKFAMIKKNPVSTSDKLMVCQVDDVSDFTCAGWDGATLGTWTNPALDTGITSVVTRSFDIAWDPSGSTGLVVYDTNSGSLDWRTFDFTGSSPSFSTPQTAISYANNHRWIRATTNPTDADNVNSLWLVMDDGASPNTKIGSVKRTASALSLISTTSHTADAGTFTAMEIMDVKFQISTLVIRDVGESLGVTDGRNSNQGKNLAETLSLSDVLTTAAQFIRTLNETLALTDTNVRTYSRKLDETLTLSDTVNARISVRNLSETLTLSDTVIKSTTMNLQESLALSDTVNARISVRNLAETLTLSDTVNARISVRNLAETLTLSDTVNARITVKNLSETISLSDATSRTVTMNLQESLALSDTVNARISVRNLAETLTLSDTVAKSTTMNLSETLTLSDTVNARISVRNLAETLTLSDTVAKSTTMNLSE